MGVDLNLVKKEIQSISKTVFSGIVSKPSNFKFLEKTRKNINIYFKLGTKKYIFRINIKAINESSTKNIKKEIKIFKFLEKHRLSEQKLIYFSKKGCFFTHPYIILTYIKGKEVSFNNEKIKEIARMYAKINNTRLFFFDRFLLVKEDFNSLINKLKEKEIKFSLIAENVSSLYKNIKHNIFLNMPCDLKNDNYLIHGDLNSKNIIENKDKIYFIDWENFKIGIPLMDIAKLMSLDNLKKYEKTFFKEYTKYFNKIDNIYEKFLFYKDLQIYFWLVLSTENYFNNIISSNIKIKQISNKQHIEDIFKNYKYLYKKKYTSVKIDDFKKMLRI